MEEASYRAEGSPSLGAVDALESVDINPPRDLGKERENLGPDRPLEASTSTSSLPPSHPGDSSASSTSQHPTGPTPLPSTSQVLNPAADPAPSQQAGQSYLPRDQPRRPPWPLRNLAADMSSRSNRGSGSSHGSQGSGKKGRTSQKSVKALIESLQTHRVNTLTELCRIERVAATCDSEEDARSFQEPMTTAWDYYVNSNQMLTELRGLTRNYPFCGDILADAHLRVRSDPDSNRSWNLAWLCLVKIRDDNLIATYASSEATRPDMWGGREPDADETAQLAQCFEYEWMQAVATMLRHWSVPPTWY